MSPFTVSTPPSQDVDDSEFPVHRPHSTPQILELRYFLYSTIGGTTRGSDFFFSWHELQYLVGNLAASRCSYCSVMANLRRLLRLQEVGYIRFFQWVR
jgi:hypothetical protein